MLFDPLDTRLRRLLRARSRPRDAAHQRALERHLEARFSARSAPCSDPPGPATPLRGGTPRWLRWPLAARLAVAGLAVVASCAAACQLPVELDMELGKRLVFELPAGAVEAGRLEAMSMALQSCCGAETIELRVRTQDGGPVHATLDVWGAGLDLAALEAALAEQGLAPDEVEELVLEGPVRTTLGARLRHELLDLELDLGEMSVEQARRQILEGLEREGFAGEAEVKIEDSATGRRVEVRLKEEERHVEGPRP